MGKIRKNKTFILFFIVDLSERIGDQGKACISKIKALSKSSDNCKYKEQFLRRRISYLCLTYGIINRGAIARENALLSFILMVKIRPSLRFFIVPYGIGT